MKLLILAALLMPQFALAQDGARIRQFLEQKREAADTDGASRQKPDSSAMLNGRAFDIYVPGGLPEKGQRTLVVALHGGSGWAAQLRRSLGLDAAADRHKFIALYLNGSRAGERLPERRRAWNAGTCCGQPAARNIDDTAYILSAVRQIAAGHGVAPDRIFVTGHSNGAMMAARLMCETDLFKSAVLISGALNVPGADCRAAKGRKLLAVHGVLDENYPIKGGVGPKSFAGTDFASQAESRAVFEAAGASYEILAVEGAGHKTGSISEALLRQTGKDLPETIATFFAAK